jgi:inosose dehydratase
MNHSLRRRDFTLGGLALAALSSRARAAKPGFSIGYAAIAWGDKNIKQCITDLSALGYPGIQIRAASLKEYPTPQALRDELAKAKLTFVCLSGGSPSADPAKRQEEVDKLLGPAKFAHDAGALYLQLTSPKPPPTVDKALLKSFSETLNAVGQATGKLGLPAAFHNHMGQIGQDPANLDVIMQSTDPQYVKLLLDTGHYGAAGGDPAAAIRKYGKRLGMLHIKDYVEKPGAEKKYEFVEIGSGKLDFKAIFGALKAVDYRGWVVVELDKVTPPRTPREAAAANKAFIEKTLGLSLRA